MLNDELSIPATMRDAQFIPTYHKKNFPSYNVCHGCMLSVDSASLKNDTLVLYFTLI